MWIVRLALRRPYTVAVMCVLILVMGVLSLTRMVVDIFPAIDIPVVAVVWNYPGLSAEDMERRVVLISERAYSTTVNGIERIESQSIPGIGMLKVYFQPGADIGAAIAQISSVSQHASCASRRRACTPPDVIQFNASNVPVAQLTRLERDAARAADLRLRARTSSACGCSPSPAWRRRRRSAASSAQINVDIDPRARWPPRGSRPTTWSTRSTVVERHPARRAPRASADREYNVVMNSSPPSTVDRVQQHPGQGRGRRAGAPRRRGARRRRLRRSRPTSCASTASAPPTWRSSSTPTPRRSPWSTPTRDVAAADQGRGARRARAQARLRPVAVRARAPSAACCARRSSRRCWCR